MVAGEDSKGGTDADAMARANAEAAADAAKVRRAVETQEAINADDPRDIEQIVAEAVERAARDREQADSYYRDKAARGSGQADQQQKLNAGVSYGPPLFHPDGVTPPIPGGTSAFRTFLLLHLVLVWSKYSSNTLLPEPGLKTLILVVWR